MTTHHPDNERIKRRYLGFLKEAKRKDQATIDDVAKAIKRFEVYTKFRDFKAFHTEQAIGFKKHLAGQTSQKTGDKLSKATQKSTLAALKQFFEWLSDKPGYRSRLQYSDAEYFNLSEKDMRIAGARREKKIPTLEQIRHVIATMPGNTDIERRNRALIAFTLMTGARDGAIASFKLKHIDLVGSRVDQDAREVKTKFSKTFTTYFFPVGDDIQQIVVEWVRFLREERLWGNDDPLFPATQMSLDAERQFSVDGLKREHWSTAAPIRKIFRHAFTLAGLPYYNPHTFRNTLAMLGRSLCRGDEEALKAWSQNFGHELVATTLYYCGDVATHRQGDIIKSLGQGSSTCEDSVSRKLRAAIRKLLEMEE